MRIGDEFMYEIADPYGIKIVIGEVVSVRGSLAEVEVDGSRAFVPLDFDKSDPNFRGWVPATYPSPNYYFGGLVGPNSKPIQSSPTPLGPNHCPECTSIVEHKVFNSFEYDYCPKCKTEVKQLALRSS